MLRNKINIRSFILCSTVLLALTTKAQDFYDDDARFWLYLKVDKKLSSRWEAQLNIQNRFNNNVTEYSQLNLNGEVSYKIKKYFKIEGGYVWGQKRKLPGFYLSRQQIYAGFLLKQKFRYFTFVYRNLVQGQTRASYNREKARTFEYFDRNKFTVKYELNKRLVPYLAAEFNVPLSPFLDPTQKAHFAVNRLRTFAGIEYNITRRSYLETYILYQRKYLTKGLPPRDFIYGVTYAYSF